MLAALLEGDAGAGDDVLHGARDEHLAGTGGRCDSGSDVDCDSADARVGLLDLAGVDADAGLDAEITDRRAVALGPDPGRAERGRGLRLARGGAGRCAATVGRQRALL